MIQDAKYSKLIDTIKSLESVIVAFSGGVDSTFLLKVCHEALGDKAKAVTVMAPYIPKWEIDEAKEIVSEIGIAHEIIEVPVKEQIRYNPENRCYLCKTFIFSTIKDMAFEQGYKHVVDGSNYDDTKDYRPGLIALAELEIKSPLLEVEMTKDEIRRHSKELGLKTWDKPAYACLLTRIPYDTELKVEDFRLIEEAEKYMMSKGFRAVRVRKHGDLARIEVARNDRHRLLDEVLLDDIGDALKTMGFNYVTMDVKGYKVGSFNEVLLSTNQDLKS
jgi:uncharacterized protein